MKLHSFLVSRDLREVWVSPQCHFIFLSVRPCDVIKGSQFNLACYMCCLDDLPILSECHYSIKPSCSCEVLSDMYRSVRSPRPIFSTPLRMALCLSMCLGKTAFCTNWSQWHRLQGRVCGLRLHGNTCWQVCDHWGVCIGIAGYTQLKLFTERD